MSRCWVILTRREGDKKIMINVDFATKMVPEDEGTTIFLIDGQTEAVHEMVPIIIERMQASMSNAIMVRNLI
jgi:hypothetical protein